MIPEISRTQIEELNLDEDGLDIETLEHEIRNYWIEREFAN